VPNYELNVPTTYVFMMQMAEHTHHSNICGKWSWWTTMFFIFFTIAILNIS